MNAAVGPGSANLFFALWPDQGCAGRLSSLAEDFAARLGGRAMQKDTLHLTLAFVGRGKDDCLSDLMALAGEVAEALLGSRREAVSCGAAEVPVISLDRLGCWRAKGILWAASDRLPPQCTILADRLRDGLVARGYVLAPRPFAAHVTLVRRIRVLPAAGELEVLKETPIAWACKDFVLVRSHADRRGPAYERLGAWCLGIETDGP